MFEQTICVFLCLCFWYKTLIHFDCICSRCFWFWKVHVEINTWIIVRSLWGQSDTMNNKAKWNLPMLLVVEPVFLISHVPVSSCQIMSHLYPINSTSCIIGRLFEKCGTPSDKGIALTCFNHMVRCDPLSQMINFQVQLYYNLTSSRCSMSWIFSYICLTSMVN